MVACVVECEDGRGFESLFGIKIFQLLFSIKYLKCT